MRPTLSGGKPFNNNLIYRALDSIVYLCRGVSVYTCGHIEDLGSGKDAGMTAVTKAEAINL